MTIVLNRPRTQYYKIVEHAGSVSCGTFGNAFRRCYLHLILKERLDIAGLPETMVIAICVIHHLQQHMG